MSEHKSMLKNDFPITKPYLEDQFQQLGIRSDMTVIVHSSLSSLGWVCGGPETVILALEEVLNEGNLIMPTHSSALSDPEEWCNPPVPENWWPTIRKTMPAFQADLTACRAMGIIPEVFRKQQGVLRSDHPQCSFAARGKQAEYIINEHPLSCGFGEQSPLGKLYELDGYVLLLGVGHDSNTSLHLAEWKANYPNKKIEAKGAPILVNGERQWVNFQDLDYDEEDFEALGRAFETQTNDTKRQTIGQAECQLISQRKLVDFAVKWFEKHRQ